MTAPNLQLPRAQWRSHPHYPRQVLLVGSHKGFRRVSGRLVAQARAGEDANGIGRSFRYWKAAMRSHEGYEEQKLYPFLEARWGLTCDSLREGHRQLKRAETDVHAALKAKARPNNDVGGADLTEALRHHDAVLGNHLDDEEVLVVPALLALAPAEFDTYYRSNIRSLLAQLGRS